MSSRGLREGEKDALNEYTVALDGVAVIVNNGNPINNIAIETVKDIFTGETTSWSQIND
jgi:phosphate transport system substrate-binding protein